MTGTSLDGLDAVLVDFSGFPQQAPRLLACRAAPFPDSLRAELFALQGSGSDELHRAALAGIMLSDCYADAVRELLADSNLQASAIRAVGAHGQTLRHRPELGYSLQWQAPAHLVERCGIAVIADFRSRDIAAGGQGAPLLPGFLQAWLTSKPKPLAVVNLGGMANVALLEENHVTGFDTGPGNVLIDAWCSHVCGLPFDEAGQWSARGAIDAQLLDRFLKQEPYFQAPPPKSTGRDLFNWQWLSTHVRACRPQYAGLLNNEDSSSVAALRADVQASPAAMDVAATLTDLTAVSVASSIPGDYQQAYAYGGGTRNDFLMSRLRAARPELGFETTDSLGIPAQYIEATAFAWLAYAHEQRQAGNIPSVTAAAGPRILGAYYPV